MPTAKRLGAAALATVVLVAAAVTSAAGSASAYPSGTNPQISLSHTSGSPGDSVNVVGEHFTPHNTATLSFHSASIALGTVNVNGQGGFTVTVTVPDVGIGTHTVHAVDNASGISADPAVFTITASGAGSAGGGLASTGVAVLGIALLGMVLLVGGGLMLLAGRRRKVVG